MDLSLKDRSELFRALGIIEGAIASADANVQTIVLDALEIIDGVICRPEVAGQKRYDNCVLSNYCPNCGAKMDGGNEDG